MPQSSANNIYRFHGLSVLCQKSREKKTRRRIYGLNILRTPAHRRLTAHVSSSATGTEMGRRRCTAQLYEASSNARHEKGHYELPSWLREIRRKTYTLLKSFGCTSESPAWSRV